MTSSVRDIGLRNGAALDRLGCPLVVATGVKQCGRSMGPLVRARTFSFGLARPQVSQAGMPSRVLLLNAAAASGP
jgi:hypothetical protein